MWLIDASWSISNVILNVEFHAFSFSIEIFRAFMFYVLSFFLTYLIMFQCLFIEMLKNFQQTEQMLVIVLPLTAIQ